MFGSISLALGAVSTISSLLETAAAGINKAAASTPSAATPTASTQSFATAAATTTAARTYGAPKTPGVVLPKFNQRTQAALLAYQEMHRGG